MKYDSIELIIQNNENGNIYEVSNIVSDIKTSKSINNSAGKCNFTLDFSNKKLEIPLGSIVRFSVIQNNKKYGKFFGYIFEKEFNEKNKLSVTAYDQLRYLKNNETFILTNKTLKDVINIIGNQYQLRLGEVEGNEYILPQRIEDNKSLGDIIQRAIDFTLQGTKKKYIIRDEFGYLCCRDVSKLVTDLIIGNVSLLNTYNYKESIDNEVYNCIKLYKDNEKTGKRETYITLDSNNIKKWGKLQKYESVNENMNEYQIKEKADQLLYLYNRINKTISLKCQGVLKLEVGNGIFLEIIDIPGVKFNHNALITKIEDEFKNGNHNMELEVMI